MAVSLISTGVQFPDSTIQTTAATASVAPGLVYLTSGTISAGTSSVNITSAAFSSSYDAYFLYINGSVPSQDTVYMYFILDGTVLTQSGQPYKGVYLQASSGSASASIFNNYYVPLGLNTGTQFSSTVFISGTLTSGINNRLTAFSTGEGIATSGSPFVVNGCKVLGGSTSYTTFSGVQLNVDAGGTFGTTTYKIYGYKPS